MAAKLITGVVDDEHKPAKADLLALMVGQGVERVRVTDDDGVDLGTVSLSRSGGTAAIVDSEAFAAWVAARYPGELMQVVRPAFEKKVLAGAVGVGAPIDVATGEVVPGVSLFAGKPYVTVRPSSDAVSRMRSTLLVSGLLRLPTGPELDGFDGHDVIPTDGETA
jgi:hypothetical protein